MPWALQERTATQAMPNSEEAPAELIDSVLSNSYQRRVPGSGDMRHGSEGWHALETSCKVLLALVLTLPSDCCIITFTWCLSVHFCSPYVCSTQTCFQTTSKQCVNFSIRKTLGAF